MHLRYPPAHPLLFAVLLLFFCHHSRAESVNILDFGAKPGAATDSAPALVKALEYAKSHAGCTIVIPKGQFYIKTISDPASIQPPARFHLRASGLKKVTIQGQGAESEILFGQFAAGIMLEKCEGVTIKNLVFDYAFPLFSQGQVLGYSPANHGLTLKPDAGYPSPLNSPETIFANPGACWMTLNKKGMELAFFGALFVEKTEAEAGNVRYIIANRPGNAGEFINRFQGGSQTGALAGVRYVRVSRNAGQLLRLDFCSDVIVEKVSIYAASGFTMLGCMCRDVTVRGCAIKPRPGSTRMISTCADGLHFIGGQGKFLIENNIFDSLEDDNINIILRGNKVESSPAPNVLKLKGASVRYYAVGDTVRVYDCVHSTYTEYKILGVDAAPKGALIPIKYTLTLDRPVVGPLVFASQENDALPTLVFNASWDFGDVMIRNNKCLNNRARGVRIAASGVTVENNYFDLASYPSIVVHSTIRDNHFDEGLSFPSNITLRNNTLIRSLNNGGCTGDGGAISVEISDEIGRKHPDGCQFLENITITGNRIIDSGRAGIACFNAGNLRIENNEIQNPNLLLKSKERVGIQVKNSANVTVKNNIVKGANVDLPVMLDQGIEHPNK